MGIRPDGSLTAIPIKSSSMSNQMLFIVILLTSGVLLASTGCISRENQDRPVHPAAAAGGVDHGEHPGDLDHGDTMQK